MWGHHDAQARRYAEAFQEQFLACNQALLKQRSINCSLSGSTGVVALLQACAYSLSKSKYYWSYAVPAIRSLSHRRYEATPWPGSLLLPSHA